MFDFESRNGNLTLIFVGYSINQKDSIDFSFQALWEFSIFTSKTHRNHRTGECVIEFGLLSISPYIFFPLGNAPEPLFTLFRTIVRYGYEINFSEYFRSVRFIVAGLTRDDHHHHRVCRANEFADRWLIHRSPVCTFILHRNIVGVCVFLLPSEVIRQRKIQRIIFSIQNYWMYTFFKLYVLCMNSITISRTYM